jgi:lipopolysaccharide/colanic/teichoic acid biosynthesis glycosyltransferase
MARFEGCAMSLSKRLFDVVVALLLMIILAPVLAILAIWILMVEGGPVFYVSERMRDPQTAFGLLKFRTMRMVKSDSGVSGLDKLSRITRTGHWLRRARLDELPQLWNVLKGDISFVGPRPPLREYVERFPRLYEEVLKSRPGITGLASITFHKHEHYLLSKSQSAAETDAIYCRSCVPRKAKLDLLYQHNRSLCFDIVIMLKTVWRAL